MIDLTHIKAHCSASGGKKGEKKQAIGGSRGGRNTKIHALADAKGRLLSSVADGRPGARLPTCPAPDSSRQKPPRSFSATRLIDSAPLRQWLKDRGTKAVVPNKSNRKQPFSFDKKSYRQRHRIENAFQSAQGLRFGINRHSLRQAGAKLPRLRLPRCCYRVVDLMSLGTLVASSTCVSPLVWSGHPDGSYARAPQCLTRAPIICTRTAGRKRATAGVRRHLVDGQSGRLQAPQTPAPPALAGCVVSARGDSSERVTAFLRPV